MDEISVDSYRYITINKAPEIFDLKCMLEELDINCEDLSEITKAENSTTKGILAIGWIVGEGENELPYVAYQNFSIYEDISLNGYRTQATCISSLRFLCYPFTTVCEAEHSSDVIAHMNSMLKWLKEQRSQYE